MGVFVFAAGIAIFSAKVWSSLNRRKKAKRAFLLEGILPGYLPLNEASLQSLTSFAGETGNNRSDDIPASSLQCSPVAQETDESFFHERIKNLLLAVRHSDEFRCWEADYTEASLSDLERWLLEYQNLPFPTSPSEAKKRQTLSLFHDIAAYVIKTATGVFPALCRSGNEFSPAVVQIIRRLTEEPTEDADRQLLLQVYYQLKDTTPDPTSKTVYQEKK